MVNQMTEEVNNLKDDFFSKQSSLSPEELIQMKNYLTDIKLSLNKMADEKEEIYKSINRIRKILG